MFAYLTTSLAIATSILRPMHLRNLIAVCLLIGACPVFSAEVPAQWTILEPSGALHPRHEAGFVSVGDLMYLLGGRRIQPVDIFDPVANRWRAGTPPPGEIHHFQPVVIEGKIWLPGAMSGVYPHERPLDHIPVYDPELNAWGQKPTLPTDRVRGAAGAVIAEGKLYLLCGITNGHWDGSVPWCDVCDLAHGTWQRLPDAPRARDHFQAAIIAGKIYLAGGRRTSGATNHVFDQTEPAVDVFDVAAGSWSTLPQPAGNLPTPRAGTMAIVAAGQLLIAGGESTTQDTAHAEVEALDPKTGSWRRQATLATGRHGSGIGTFQTRLFIASGSGRRGGVPELPTVESFDSAK